MTPGSLPLINQQEHIVVDRGAVIKTTLGADVANNGTVALAYPSGFAQGNFTTGLNGPNGLVIVNKNDRWTVSAAQCSFSFGSTTVTITNLSGVTWTAGSDFYVDLDAQDGNDVLVIQVPVFALSGVSAAAIAAGIRPGVYGTIENLEWVQGAPVTTASKLATATPTVNGTPTTGGAVALTSAACTPLGAVIEGSAITAGNKITPADSIGIVGSSVTTFAEGSGFFNIRIRKTASQFA
jgi:hypothetical protein